MPFGNPEDRSQWATEHTESTGHQEWWTHDGGLSLDDVRTALDEGRTRWNADQCAYVWGITPSTWRAYVGTGRAPQPLPGYDTDRRRQWDADAVMAWQRPGQGARTDLQKETD